MKLRKIALVMTMVLALGSGNVFGATKTSSKTTAKTETIEQLTVESATTAAVAASDKIAGLKESIAGYEETQKRINNSFINSTMTYAQVLSKQDEQTQNDTALATAKQDLKLEPESIELSVVKSFVAILDAEAALVQYNKSFALQEKSFAITTLKKELGMISDSDFDTEKTSFEKTRDSRKTYVDNIDNAYRDLNRLMGKDTNKKYNLVFDVEYELLGDVNLNTIISSCVSVDKLIKSNLATIGLTENQIQTYMLRIVNDYTGELNTDAASKESYERKVSQYNREIESRVETIEDTVKTLHTNIINLESDYDKKTAELANMYRQLEIKKVQLELGQITELELQSFQVNSIDKTESEIKSLIYNHYVQVLKFSNTNLAAQ